MSRRIVRRAIPTQQEMADRFIAMPGDEVDPFALLLNRGAAMVVFRSVVGRNIPRKCLTVLLQQGESRLAGLFV